MTFRPSNTFGLEARFGGARSKRRYTPPDLWNRLFRLASGIDGEVTPAVRKTLGIPDGFEIADGIVLMMLKKILRGETFYVDAYLKETEKRRERHFAKMSQGNDTHHVVVVTPGIDGAPELPGDAIIQKIQEQAEPDNVAEYDLAEEQADRLNVDPEKPKYPTVLDPDVDDPFS